MKKFTVPADIQLRNPETGERVEKPLPFRTYSIRAWFNDERMGASPVALARLSKFLPKFMEAKAGDIIEMEDADWEMVAAVVREPKPVFTPMYALQFLPYSTAFLEAE